MKETYAGSGATQNWQALYNNIVAPEPPETGLVLDIILPSAVIVMVLAMTIVVWKKKEY